MAPRALRLVTAAVLAAVTGLAAVVAVPGPAHAATCATGSGVTVVVDFKQLGGGVQSFCASDGAGRSAATVVGAAFDLTYVQRQPGFLCRVDGVPADDPCVNTPPATAYWGLFHSDGTSGSWTFSSLGIGSLEVDDGGSIGLAWQQGGTRSTPGLAAPVHAGEPSPTSTPEASAKPSPKPSPTKPTRSPTGQPSDAPATPGSSPSAEASADGAAGAPSATPGPDRDRRDGRGRSDGDRNEGHSAAPDESAGSTPAEGATDPSSGEATELDPVAAEASGGGRLPTVLTLLALAVLLLGVVVAFRRRRRTD